MLFRSGLVDVEAIVRVGRPPHDWIANIDRPVQFIGKTHGIAQIGRRTNIFNNGFDITGKKVRNGFNGAGFLIDGPQ